MTPKARVHKQRTAIRSALRDFLQAEAAGGLLLVFAAAIALVWANSPWVGGMDVFDADLGPLDARHWINDGLMALFFLVVGLEISRELTIGELRSPRVAALPVFAAIGGMAVPAAIFIVVNNGAAGERGWGVPMATDIAFCVGVMALLGRRVPPALKLFLLSLAIVDDLGAIVVIAFVYSGSIALFWLAGALVSVVAVALLRGNPIALVVLGGVAWWCMYRSGVHPTLAGVLLGFAVPPRRGERYERVLHPITTTLVVPLFALANAGVVLTGGLLDSPGTTRVAIGVAAGLIVGKVVGIGGASWLAISLGLARLPEGVRPRHLVGAGLLAGIGFTVSLFIADLAFVGRPALEDAARAAILASSVLAAIAGAAVLWRAGPD